MRSVVARSYRRLTIVGLGVSIAAAMGCSDPGGGPGGGRGGSGATGATGSGGGGRGGSGGSSGGTGGSGGATGGTGGSTGGSGGTTTTGGSGGTGGAAGKGGSAGSGGTAAGGTSGTSGAGGSAGAGGASGGGGTGGASGAGGASGKAGADGGAGTGGSAGSGGASDAGKEGGGTTDSGGTTGDGGARFSFFMTSLASMRMLSGNQNGFGGDLRFAKTNGLDGADEICRRVAEIGMAGNGKTWRAFLSVTAGPSGTPVNAIDRIGAGPWYDRLGRVFAMTKAALLMQRPQGADPAILNDFPNEFGVPNHNPDGTVIDNHNVLTGSNTMGNINGTNKSDTCQDWTSSVSNGGAPRCGVSWPRSSLIHWISVLNEGGCAPGVTPPGADSGPSGTVGALGGYGGIYCFALTP
ncbi:MAG TPA: hypothetical protein VK540_29430 [Polyangiaceae bacterium]|nr:hypothetical protein [Polyangiaceae bacterium]